MEEWVRAVEGESERPRLNPADLELLLAAMKRSAAQPDIVDRPPVAATGLDAAIYTQVIRAELRPIYERLDRFLTAEEIAKRQREMFERIGLRVDDEHYEATGDAVRGFLKWHKRADKVLSGLALSILGAIGYALLKLIGINLPSSGGGS